MPGLENPQQPSEIGMDLDSAFPELERLHGNHELRTTAVLNRLAPGLEKVGGFSEVARNLTDPNQSEESRIEFLEQLLASAYLTDREKAPGSVGSSLTDDEKIIANFSANLGPGELGPVKLPAEPDVTPFNQV